MELIDFIVIGIIVLIVGSALAYIIKAKKSGKTCIGCPDSASCHKKRDEVKSFCSGCCSACSCGCDSADKDEKTLK